jgi:hypothetical protein
LRHENMIMLKFKCLIIEFKLLNQLVRKGKQFLVE